MYFSHFPSSKVANYVHRFVFAVHKPTSTRREMYARHDLATHDSSHSTNHLRNGAQIELGTIPAAR